MDQWLRTNTCQNLKQNTNSDVLSSSTTDMSENSVQKFEIAQSSVLQRGVKRKYSDEYIKYGFLYIGDENCLKPKGSAIKWMHEALISFATSTYKTYRYKHKDCDFF